MRRPADPGARAESLSRRRTVTAVACVAGAAVLVTGGVLVGGADRAPAGAETATSQVRTTTAVVEKGDLRGTTTKQGTLQRTGSGSVPAGLSGTLTALPAAGSILHPGDELYRVDNRPVTLLTGSLPQWRSFEPGMADGPDVGQLERALRDLGHLQGTADDHFDSRTSTAIRAWQRATGRPVTGTIERGEILFGTGDRVVAERRAAVGDQVAPGQTLYATTGVEKVVHVAVPLGSPLARKGGEAEIALPTGQRVAGHIRSVGEPTTDADGKTTQTVEIVLADAKAVATLNDVDVTVDFVSETRKDVLSVPVTALGAASGGGFVVERVGSGGSSTQVPVKAGLFAGDRVEIVSGALKAGDRIVVPR